MMQYNIMQQHEKIVLKTEGKIFEANSLNHMEDDIPSKEKIGKEDPAFINISSFSLSNFEELKAILLNSVNEQEKLVTLCQRTIERTEFPEKFDLWTTRSKYDYLINNMDKYFPNIPESLRYMLPAVFEDGDCGQSAKRPSWLDMNKFRRGQKFIRRHFGAICQASVLTLIQISLFDGLKTLILSQKSNTPYRAFTRYLSTIDRVRNWYLDDPWTEGTKAYQDIQTVRKLHLYYRRKLCKNDDKTIDKASKLSSARCLLLKTLAEDFKDACASPMNLHCPYLMNAKGINQAEMSGTQFAFMGLPLVYPEELGIHNASDEDLEAYCHVWRGIGYLLGIKDEYNFCRGSLQDVKRRAEDFVEHWVKPQFLQATPEWEHMSRCLFKGLGYYLPITPYQISLLYLCDILKLNMPRLYQSITLRGKLHYMLHKLLFRYLMKVSVIRALINAAVNMSIDKAKSFGLKKHLKLRRSSEMFLAHT